VSAAGETRCPFWKTAGRHDDCPSAHASGDPDAHFAAGRHCPCGAALPTPAIGGREEIEEMACAHKDVCDCVLVDKAALLALKSENAEIRKAYEEWKAAFAEERAKNHVLKAENARLEAERDELTEEHYATVALASKIVGTQLNPERTRDVVCSVDNFYSAQPAAKPEGEEIEEAAKFAPWYAEHEPVMEAALPTHGKTLSGIARALLALKAENEGLRFKGTADAFDADQFAKLAGERLGTIQALEAENARLTAERDATQAMYRELHEAYVGCERTMLRIERERHSLTAEVERLARHRDELIATVENYRAALTAAGARR
jgi:hypothetical protein